MPSETASDAIESVEPTPSASPTPTSPSAPPKPTGVDFSRCCGEGNDEPVSEAWWAQPRTAGIEIRIYGVTACFPLPDGSDDQCLREHTQLPADVRVLLATAPASAGTASWFQDEDQEAADLCAGAMVDRNGTRYYSVVLQAVDGTARSTFAIADQGWYDNEECTSYTVQPGDTLAKIAGRYGITTDDLVAANLSTLLDPDKLPVGGTILIPSDWLVETRDE
jgi:nucleoid-associated protein YgaU